MVALLFDLAGRQGARRDHPLCGLGSPQQRHMTAKLRSRGIEFRPASCPSPRDRHSRIANFSGGLAQSQSLRELSDWCEERLGPLPADCDPRKQTSSTEADRPFDIPWMILDATRAQQIWGWQPQTSLPDILEEIARHATDHPEWLDLVTASHESNRSL